MSPRAIDETIRGIKKLTVMCGMTYTLEDCFILFTNWKRNRSSETKNCNPRQMQKETVIIENKNSKISFKLE